MRQSIQGSKGDKMNVSSVGVTGFVSDRKTDLDFLKSLQYNAEVSSSASRKRCLDRIKYRTRSFQPYKLRRIASRNKVVDTAKSNRRQRRSMPIALNGVDRLSYQWQVKRMFMIKCCKPSMPSHSRKFGYKAVERFAMQRCVVHDMSYYRCVVVKSSGSGNILEFFSQFIDSQSVLFTLSGSKNYKRDVGELSVEFHRRDKFPTQCIGVVLISYTSDRSTNEQQLSLWMHPSIYDDVMQELLAVEEELQQSDSALTLSTVQCNHLGRISLRGPKTIDALKSLISSTNDSSSRNLSSSSSSAFLSDLLTYKHMNRLWLPGHVLSVDLQFDPTLRKKTGCGISSSGKEGISDVSGMSLKWPFDGSLSPLWQEDSTREAMKGFKTYKARPTIRSRWLTVQSSGSTTSTKQADSALSIPIVLIRKSLKHVDVRNKSSDLSGWDLILPREAVGPVWQSLIYSGVIPLGCEEVDHLTKGVAALSFPRDYLDSLAGQKYWEARREEGQRRNKARPLRNRQETADIIPLLSMLQKGAAVDQFDPSRDMLTEYPLSRVMVVRGAHYSADFAPPAFDVEQFRSRSLPSVKPLPPLPPLALLNVTLRMTSRGLPQDLAQLLRPLPTDVEAWLEGCERRKRRREKSGESSSSKNQSSMWRGVKLKHYNTAKGCYSGRPMVGFVTSGQKPHLNSESVVVAVCSASLLHEVFVQSFGQYAHPQAHFLVLVRNARSQWLRPALVSIM